MLALKGNCVLLITGEVHLLERILILTSDFSFGTYKFRPAKVSLEILFKLSHNFQTLHKF